MAKDAAGKVGKGGSRRKASQKKSDVSAKAAAGSTAAAKPVALDMREELRQKPATETLPADVAHPTSARPLSAAAASVASMPVLAIDSVAAAWQMSGMGDDWLLASLAVLLAVLIPLYCFTRTKRSKSSPVKMPRMEQASDFQEYGKYKYCGLRPDPFSDSPAPVFFRNPPQEKLPSAAFQGDEEIKVLELEQRVLDITRAARHRTDRATLLRFIRARKGNVEKAEYYLREAAKWYEKYDIHNVFTTWNLDVYEKFLRPYWLSGGLMGHGKNGEPVGWERIGKCHWPKLCAAVPFEAWLKVDQTHCMRCMAALEEDALRRGTPFKSAIFIIDVKGFGMEDVDFTAARMITKLADNRNMLMPECVARMIIIRAPKPFARAWGLFSHMLDPGTKSKAFVADEKSSLDVLRQYMDDDQIPAYLGGTCKINGDGECAKILAPGGVPPEHMLEQFKNMHEAAKNGVPLKVLESTRIPTWNPDQDADSAKARRRCCCGI
eukprot:TRINITY_DN10035_c0_g1_i1.p1 TRINITY_DN10035_c0_g1~~TRINITY_DN10035_c0_g1_i1.p1  ORF type:complete len:493 (+),score=104.22 TRINITY_DN10035_c0_g1_i1:102-1580(+)